MQHINKGSVLCIYADYAHFYEYLFPLLQYSMRQPSTHSTIMNLYIKHSCKNCNRHTSYHRTPASLYSLKQCLGHTLKQVSSIPLSTLSRSQFHHMNEAVLLVAMAFHNMEARELGVGRLGTYMYSNAFIYTKAEPHLLLR